jgi:hypothetical protein
MQRWTRARCGWPSGPGWRWHPHCSGSYVALGAVPGAVTVDVVSDDSHGRRQTVSHHNKSHKGLLARLLATAPREVSDAAGVARIARRGGLRVHRTGEHELELIVGT